jgi:hypothetical protein
MIYVQRENLSIGSGAEELSDRHLTDALSFVIKCWMDRIEQRVMMKYVFLKRHASKLSHKELVSRLQEIGFHCPSLRIRSRYANPAIFPATTKNGLEDF